MDDIEPRLIRCFSSVFPGLSSEEIRKANAETVAAWDSLAAVTLVAVLQEEFGVQIDFGDLPNLGSFDAVKSYLENQNAGAPRTSSGT